MNRLTPNDSTGETTPVRPPALLDRHVELAKEAGPDVGLQPQTTPPEVLKNKPGPWTSDVRTDFQSEPDDQHGDAADHSHEGPTLDPPPLTGPARPISALVTRVLPVILLLFVIAYLGLKIRDKIPTRPNPTPASTAAIGDTNRGSGANTDTYNESESSTYTDTDPESESGTIGDTVGDPSTRLGALLDYRVERYDPATKKTEKVVLRESSLRSGTVSVVNLWATWCDACKEELPGFQQIFVRGAREDAWGAEVRFIALMLSDGSRSDSAHREFKNWLPPDTEFLADRGLDPILEGLKERSLLPDSEALPVTFLLDCHRRVRWHYMGALDKAAFADLDTQIRTLRADLSSKKCRRKKTPKKKPPSCNRNGTCEDGEDIKICPSDCKPVL